MMGPANKNAGLPQTADELLTVVRERGCLVFGTGFVATMFTQALRINNAQDSVRGYIVSRCAEPHCFEGKDVLQASNPSIDRDMLVCVAVHMANAPDVTRLLETLGYTRVVWVYPHLYNLLYGEPLYRSVNIEVRHILAAQDPAHNWIAVRALAAQAIREPAFDATGESLDAYMKALAYHSGLRTAQRRLDGFRLLIQSMEEKGFDVAHPVLIDTDLRIIDGLHRIATAWLMGIDFIPCNIVKASSVYDAVLTERNKLPESALLEAGLTSSQRGLVREVSACMGVGAQAPEVSFIIPAYNVADYLDQCMESVVAQTFDDFEVLIIDDGSEDGTGARCDMWANRDARVFCLHKQNAGVSSARNLGIELARGTYLAFVDPDDWLDARYLEKLHDAAQHEGADFAECDIWRYDNRTGKKIYRSCGQRMGVRYSLEEHMKYGPTASYKAISRRSLWTDNAVRFPDCSFESPAVYALVLALAGQSNAYVHEALYYYRRFRENSLVETAYAKEPGVADNTLGVDAMNHLIQQFKARGLYDRFERQMPGIVAWRLNDILAMQYHRRSETDFAELVANQRAFLTQVFPQLPQGSYLTWGGYNLNKVLQHLPMLNDPSCRFNFSSIPAIACQGDTVNDARLVARHPNRYRQMMVQRELDQVFWKVLNAQAPQFIFVDFVDERFDLIECDGRYLTASDAFDGAEIQNARFGRRIVFGSAEHTLLWQDAFSCFVRRLRECAPQTQIIVVQNYLSERVGTPESTFPHEGLDSIRAINKKLEAFYSHARAVLPDAVFVPAYQCDWYFTDEAFEYGAVPQHLNDIVNERIAIRIWEAVLECERDGRFG